MKSKVCAKYTAFFMSFFLMFFFSPEKSRAFNFDTHKYVTESALELISEAGDTLKSSKSITSDEYDVLENLKKNSETITVYSNQPDKDEKEGAYKNHFYNPATQRNYMGERESALTKCVDHFKNAVLYYKNNQKDMAYGELGRSVHFLEDLCTAVHTGYTLPSDSVAKLPLHVRFEKKCDLISKDCYAVIAPESLKYYECNLLENIAKSSSVLSSDNFYRLEHAPGEKNAAEEKIASDVVLNAQKKVVGLYYKFIKEVNLK